VQRSLDALIPFQITDLPVIVGVTGHRNLAPAAAAQIETTLEVLLRELHALFPSLHLACAFAEGADQLAGRVADRLELPLLAVLPMPLGGYRDSLPGPFRAELDRLVARAKLTLELPWVDEAHHHTDQYEQLGLLLARRSHILLALWDGREDAGLEAGRGGTAHVVAMRQTGSQQGRVFVDSLLFPDSRSRLDLARGGPILHVPVMREAVPVTDASAQFGLRLWRGDGPAGAAPSWQSITKPLQSHFPALLPIRDLNDEIKQIIQADEFRAAEHLGQLRADAFPDPPLGDAAPMLERLRRLQTGIDLAAQSKQLRLVGRRSHHDAWHPAGRLPGPWAGGLRLPMPGAHLLFAAAVPAAVLCFELYSNLLRSWPLLLAGYLGILLAALLYDYLHVRRHSLQTKFQDYRALAEALRVQLFWALSAVPQAVSDSYLRKQRDDLGWIRDALHGPALWATAVALAAGAPDRHQVEAVWLLGQRNFFVGEDSTGGRACDNKRMWQRCRRALYGFAGAGVIAGAGVLFVQLTEPASWKPGAFIINVLITLVGVLPAIGAFFGIYAERLALEQQAHNYAAMGTLFGRALAEARAIPDEPGCESEFCALIKEVGREALDENAEWLKEHRKRPIQFSTGV
jgi:hypothetical protein